MITLPMPSMTTQKVVLGQDTPVTGVVPSTFVTVHAAFPSVGFVDVITLPTLSTATHKLALGHEIPCTKLAPATVAETHAAAAPGGLLERTGVLLGGGIKPAGASLPPASPFTNTQRLGPAHETP